MSDFKYENKNEFIEQLIQVNRISKAVKGGRKMSFSALMVIGDGNGNVGYGMGKANDVSDAIRKSSERARKSMIHVPMKNATVPHSIKGKFKKAEVLLKPAAPGTGIIAGGPVRAIMEASGIHDILAKSLGSSNTMNIVKAVFNGLENIFNAEELAQARGKSLVDFWG